MVNGEFTILEVSVGEGDHVDSSYPNRYRQRVDVPALMKEARRRAGMTQAQLAHAAGTSQSTLAAYESGAKSPSVRTLDRVIRAAGASLDVRLRSTPATHGALLAELRGHSREIRAAARKRGIRKVRVFGSAARGDETAHSDVDLLVEFDAATHGVLQLAGFASDMRALIGRDVDVTTPELLRDEVRRTALAEAVPL